jgi:hypothetical protein
MSKMTTEKSNYYSKGADSNEELTLNSKNLSHSHKSYES